MKKNINLIALWCSLIFNILGFTIVNGQEVLTKNFSKELTINSFSTINIQSPGELDYEMHATMSSTYDKEDGYLIRPGVKGEVPCLIMRNYDIKTWDKNSIKQEVVISILPDPNSPNEAQNLLNNLKLNFPENASQEIFIDANLNIQKMELINGFFRRDRNTFILEDGSKYDIRQLVIQSTLFIPKKSNVILDKVVGHVKMGNLEGQLTINANGGSIQCGNIQHLKANLFHFEGFFKHIETGIINAEFSKIDIQNVHELTIGLPSISKKENNSLFEKRGRGALSFSNNYKIDKVTKLMLTDSGSDHFNLGMVTHFEALNSTFSNYYIKNLEKELQLYGKNGDVFIYDVQADFKSIEIDNQISTIDLNMESVPSYQLIAYKNERNEFRLTSDLKKVSENNSGKLDYWKGKKEKSGKVVIRCESCQVNVK